MLKLIAVLVSGIPAIIAAFVAFMARKLSTGTIAIATFVIMTVAFVACINSILQSVLAILTMPAWVANSVGMFTPGTFSAAVASVVSSRICRVAYDLAVKKVELMNSAS